MNTKSENLGAEMINKGATMEWGSKDDGDTSEYSVGLTNTLQNWFCSI